MVDDVSTQELRLQLCYQTLNTLESGFSGIETLEEM